MKELLILKLFCKDRDNWTKYHSFIQGLNLDKELLLLFSLVNTYYEEYPEHTYLGAAELKSFFTLEYSSYKSADIIEKLIDDIFQIEVSDSLIKDYIESVLEKDTAAKVINKLLKVVDESETGLLLSIEEDIQKFKEATLKNNSDDDSLFLSTDLESLLEEEYYADGINWRLKCLQDDVGPLHGCNLIHIFARPETGKTSFVSSEITNFLRQLKEDESIIWFNNEQKGSKVALRLYSSMLNVPLSSILANPSAAKETFLKRGGNKLKLYDSAFISIEEIGNLCDKYNPRILVIDQGDKISFKGSHTQDSTIRLKNLYIKFRELAKSKVCDIITVGQAGAEAHGKKWLEQIHMDSSRTGKPGELDLSIGIGVDLSEGKEHLRYLHINKNKLTGIHSKRTVIFDSMVGRYSDMEG